MDRRVFAFAAATLPRTDAPADPAIASDGATLDVSHNECLARREAAVRRMNFSETEQTRYSRFDQNDDFTLSMRCVLEKVVVLFLAAGPGNVLRWNIRSNCTGII